jgi:hypothetical protein
MNMEGISSRHLPEVTEKNRDKISHDCNSMSTAAVLLDIEKPFIKHGTLACYINDLN